MVPTRWYRAEIRRIALTLAGIAAGLVALGLLIDRARADAVGVVARSSADAPVSAPVIAEAMADTLRGTGLQPDLDPFARARAQLDRSAVPGDRLAGFSRARNLVREGWRAYAAVDTGRALEQLTAARDVARQVIDLDGGPALYADIALRLGATHLQLGQTELSTSNFRLARALDPGREVSIALFAPDVVKAFQRANTAQPATRAYRVTSAPAARVEFDGRDLGPTPMTIQAPVGEHILVARAPGYRVHVAHFSATADDTDAVAMNLQLVRDDETSAILAGDRGLAIGQATAATRGALRAVIRYGEFTGVVLVASVWRSGEPTLLGQYCAGIPVACTRVVEIRFAAAEAVVAASAELWASLGAGSLDSPPAMLADRRLVTGESRPRSGSGGSGAGCRWCRSPWLWIGLTSAAIAASATWLIVTGQDDEPVISVDPCQFGGCP